MNWSLGKLPFTSATAYVATPVATFADSSASELITRHFHSSLAGCFNSPSSSEKSLLIRDSQLYGRHVVRPVQISTDSNDALQRLFLRERPEWPGMEAACNCFLRLFTNYEAAPHIDLWDVRWSDAAPDSGIPIAVSSGIEGKVLLDVMNGSETGTVPALDFASFCWLTLATMLINPEDAKVH